MESSDPGGVIERVQELSEAVDRLEDPRSRGLAQELMGAVLELYGEGLERIVDAIDEAGDGAEAVRGKLAEDGVVASLLLIHDLYPVPIAERVEEALESVRPYMESHGGNVELLGLDDDVASLRLEGSCDGCPASSATLELAIKSALEEAAPDLAGIEVEGLAEAPGPQAALEVSGTELPVVQAGGGNGDGASDATQQPPGAGPAWHELNGETDRVDEGTLVAVEVDGASLIVAKVDGSLLAYADSCPSCDNPIAGGDLSEGVLTCPSCERRYFLPRAGRSLDGERLHLGPVPLLGTEGGRVRVALAR